MRRSRALVLLFLTGCLLVLAAATSPARAADNPFVASGEKPETVRDDDGGGSVLGPVFSGLARLQSRLRLEMTGFAAEMKRSPWGRAFWLFLLASFAYGAAHALGPGHGKVFAVSYFLNQPGRMVGALAFGYLTMAVHVASATILVLGGYYVLKSSMAGTVEAMGDRLALASYAALAGLGLFMLLRTMGAIRKGHACHGLHEAKSTGWKELAGVSLAAGLVPCPGAALVLIYAVSSGITLAGVLAMVAISLGMGLTISVFAAAAIAGQGFLLPLLARHERTWRLAHHGISLAGALAILVLGLLLFLGTASRFLT
jgi:ABC-type nickel/cobalt efflux system permease component RcnA